MNIPSSRMSAYTSVVEANPVTAQLSKSAAAFKSEAREAFSTFGKNFDRMLAVAEEFKARWKEFGETRDLACEEVFGTAYKTLQNKILYWRKALSPKSWDIPKLKDESPAANLPGESHVNESEPEAEPAAVHSADEAKEPEAPKTRSGPKTNGVEKSKHPLWKELTETYGRLMRRADELNKVCPNKGQHGLLIQQTKVCMTTVDQWRESVR